jgi:hypothetical protein
MCGVNPVRSPRDAVRTNLPQLLFVFRHAFGSGIGPRMGQVDANQRILEPPRLDTAICHANAQFLVVRAVGERLVEPVDG